VTEDHMSATALSLLRHSKYWVRHFEFRNGVSPFHSLRTMLTPSSPALDIAATFSASNMGKAVLRRTSTNYPPPTSRFIEETRELVDIFPDGLVRWTREEEEQQ
jgi:hypothetical protein